MAFVERQPGEKKHTRERREGDLARATVAPLIRYTQAADAPQQCQTAEGGGCSTAAEGQERRTEEEE